MPYTYKRTTDNDSVTQDKRLLAFENGILQARLIRLLVEREQSQEIKRQLLASGLAHIFITLKKTCKDLKTCQFYLIPIGKNEIYPEGNNSFLLDLKSTYFEMEEEHTGDKINSRQEEEDPWAIDFFNILPFQDIKSCKDFFYENPLEAGEDYPGETVLTAADEGLRLQIAKKRISSEARDLRLIFFFHDNTHEQEHREQLLFTQSLFTDGYPLSGQISQGGMCPDRYHGYSTGEPERQGVFFESKAEPCQCHFDTGQDITEKEDSRSVITSFIYATNSLDIISYSRSDLIIVPRIDKGRHHGAVLDIFAKIRRQPWENRESVKAQQDQPLEMLTDRSGHSYLYQDALFDAQTDLAENTTAVKLNSYLNKTNQYENDPLQKDGSGINLTTYTPSDTLSSHQNDDRAIYVFSERHREYKPLYVSLLGSVSIIGSYFNFDHSPRLSELVIYLALHPEGASSNIWATALWPDKRVPMQTVANRLSEARRALGIGSDDKPRLRKIADKYFISDVTVDWFVFKKLLANNPTFDNYVDALKLVKGRPLSGLSQGQWISLEGFQTEMEEAVVNCAIKVGKWCLEYKDPDRTLWAIQQGIKANPFDERLYRLQMHAYDMVGNRVGIDKILSTLACVLELKGDPLKSVHPKTAALYRTLTGKSSLSF